MPDRGDFKIHQAPFIDYTAGALPQVADYATASGVKHYFLGFLVAVPSLGDKKVYWGGQPTLGDATISTYGQADIAKLRAAGGDVILSFGGASNMPLEEVETDVAKIVETYNAIIKNYEAKYIDFDFEGGFIRNQAALDRHMAAIVQVLKANENLQICYTLPVDGAPGSLEGFNSDGERLVHKLADNDIQPSLINGMLMEFGQTSPKDAYECCVIGMRGMHKHISAAFTDWSDAKIWRRIGACPMFGRNINGKIFTLENQKQLVDFARKQNLGCLSGWDATRDKNQGSLAQYDNMSGQDLSMCTYVDQSPYDFAKIISHYQRKEKTSSF